MEKRVILTIVICMGLLIAWQQLFPPPKPPKKEAVTATKDGGAKTSDTKGQPSEKKGSGQPGEKATAGSKGTDEKAAKPVERGPEQTVTVKTDLVEAVFTNYGAALRSWKLLDPQYRRGEGNKTIPVDLVTTTKPEHLPLQLDYKKSTFDVPADAVWKLEKHDKSDAEHKLVYVYENDAVRVKKTYVLRRQKDVAYHLKMFVSTTNKRDKEATESLGVVFTGFQNPEESSGGGFFAPPRQPRSAVCYVNGQLERVDVKKALQGAKFNGKIVWSGIDEHYFLGVVIPKDDGKRADERRCVVRGVGPGTIIAQLNLEQRSIAASKTADREMLVYLGPKVIRQLDDVGVKLDATVDFGWRGWLAWLCRPMLFLLQLFFSWFHNWGLAIILLTFTVKLATLYWTQKSMVSMKAMAKLAPKVNELKEKYGSDRNKLNEEVMKLYRQHKANPLGGCLPMLLQMPIYIALYTTLNNAVELYRTPFLGYIKDLSARDPYFIMPLVLGATMFVQQRLSPTPADNAQAKMMMYFMPVMFTVFMLFLPAGLTLYILVNTLLGIAHQWYLNRKDKKDEPPPKTAKGGKPARA